jgi:hypothetical protein
MQTDELIRSLVADDRAPQSSSAGRLVPFVLIGAAVSAAAFFAVLGPRADIAEAAATLRFDLKIVVTLMLCATAAALAVRMARPGAATGLAVTALLAAPLLLGVAAMVELSVLPRAAWATAAVGSNSMICLTAVPLLSLPVLAGAIYALRAGAPLNPTLTGAVAGVLAASAAAALYALHCTDDSPLFVATWYSLAIAIVAAAGAVAGRFALRW